MSTTRSFYTLLIPQTVSLVGSRMTSLGIGIYLYKLTGNATPLLLMAFFNELPGMLAGSLAGVWVDRWDRRKVLLFTDLGQAAGSLLLIAFLVSGSFQLWQLYLVVLLQGIFAIFQEPAENASVTMLAPEQQRDRANALREMAFPFAGIIAPVLAGLVYAAAGVSGLLVVDLTSFLIAVIALTFIRIPKPPPSQFSAAYQGKYRDEIAAGFKFLFAFPSLLALILYLSFTNLLLNGPLDLAIPYLLEITGKETSMGILLGVMSLGAFSGALLIVIWPKMRPRMLILIAGMALSGCMFLVFSIAKTPIGLGISLFLIMLPLPIANAVYMSILQAKTPPDLQGRIFSIVSQLGYLGSTISFLVTGFLVDRILEPAIDSPAWEPFSAWVGSEPGAGMRLVELTVGVLILSATVVIAMQPKVRGLESILRDYPAPESPE